MNSKRFFLIILIISIVFFLWLWTKKSDQFIKNQEIETHAGRVVNIYEEYGSVYLEINFIKFLRFIDDKDNKSVDYPAIIYGENDEEGECKPITDSYCVVDNDDTIVKYKILGEAIIIPSRYHKNPIKFSIDNFVKEKINSPYFVFKLKNNIIYEIKQIYVP